MPNRQEADARVTAVGEELREQERILRARFEEALAEAQSATSAAQVWLGLCHLLEDASLLCQHWVLHFVKTLSCLPIQKADAVLRWVVLICMSKPDTRH